MGVRTDDQGRQFNTVFSRMTLRNGSKSYTRLKDEIDGMQNQDTVWSNDPIGVISNLAEYSENVKETDLGSASAADPFAQAAALPEAGSDLPFGNSTDEDPFKGM
jgi:hypothetical protein